MSTQEHLQIDPPRSATADDRVCVTEVQRLPDPMCLLAHLYTIAAGLIALLASFGGAVIVVIGIRGVALAGRRDDMDTDFGAFLIVHGALAILIGWFCALVLFCTGRNLVRRRQYWSCFLLACYLCLVLPMLGVPTLVVLTRPGVKTSFAPSRKGWPLSIFG